MEKGGNYHLSATLDHLLSRSQKPRSRRSAITNSVASCWLCNSNRNRLEQTENISDWRVFLFRTQASIMFGKRVL